MGYKLNGKDLPIDAPFTDSKGSQYPANWLRLSTATDRAAVPDSGITWEAGPVWYDQEFYWGQGKPKTVADLKTDWVQRQKDIANSLLVPTDWMAIRAAEGGTAVPTDIKNYRAAVRTQCGLREVTINACADTDKLCATIRNTLPSTVVGTASNGATEKKQEDGSSFDPKQYNDIANPDLLEAWPTPP